MLDRVGVCAVVRASDGKGEEMLDCLSDLQEGGIYELWLGDWYELSRSRSEYDF